MKCSVEGIMYPVDARSVIFSSLVGNSGNRSSDCYVEVPHASWSVCKDSLDTVFSFGVDGDVSTVFVLAPLHKGTVCLDGFCVVAPKDGELCGSDWRIPLSVPPAFSDLVSVSDDICSEEHSLEIIAPYLSVLFPSASVCWLLAADVGASVKRIVEIIRKAFPFSPIFISNNKETQCASMWKEAFGS